MNNKGIAVAAVFAFLAVALGAFGAHGLEKLLTEHGTREIWQTAFLYHFFHALALMQFFIWGRGPAWIGKCFTFGILIFSGSLYLLAVTGIKKLGMITPIGGTFFLIAWLAWARAAYFFKA